MSYGGDADLIKPPLPEIRSELLRVGESATRRRIPFCSTLRLPSLWLRHTMRFFGRYPIEAGKTYMEVKSFCEAGLPRDATLYNHFHALIVQNGKEHCKKKKECAGCPLEQLCEKVVAE